MTRSLLVASLIALVAILDCYGYEPARYRSHLLSSFHSNGADYWQADPRTWITPSIELQPNPVQDDKLWHYDRGQI